MEDLDIKQLWKEYDRKLEESRVLNMQSWALNLQTFEYFQHHRVKSRLRPMAGFKGRAVFAGIVWALFLGALAASNQGKNLYFTVSIVMILSFTVLAIVVYLKQMALIRQIDYSENIVDTQQKLTGLQASTIRVTRILFLQTPFYSTWFWSNQMIAGNSLDFWLIAVPITLLLTLLSVWLYRNISLRNADKKWLRLLFNSVEWTPIIKAMDYLKEIEAFRDQ
ncbi:hypothetical protein [Puia dinghuensis]|uniref:Uncharacterized protein n=1 Tax=Puia dinghuensis TaxID=1792502 RepID=A0A8J2XQU3_9BACT|nr:hypothetical protein [Puia dinghuensis]GGA84270.1 hypothetical protein GCM10011511_04280 [Puia dinghuensis]